MTLRKVSEIYKNLVVHQDSDENVIYITNEQSTELTLCGAISHPIYDCIYWDTCIVYVQKGDAENFQLRNLISELLLKLLFLVKKLTKQKQLLWEGVHLQLICFSKLLKGRLECL